MTGERTGLGAEADDGGSVATTPDTGDDPVGVLRDGVDAPDRPTGRRGRLALVAAVAVGLVVLPLIFVLGTREPATDRQVDSPLVGKLAPRIRGTTLEGRDFDSAAYDGRWLVVNFFATWCVPCVKEHPELRAFERAHAEAGDANVVSVVFSDDESSVRRFFAREGGDWPVVLSENAVIPQWGVAAVPESYIVDPGGRVVVKIIGGVTADGLDRILAEAKGGR